MIFCFTKFNTAQTLHSYETRNRSILNVDRHCLELYNKLPFQSAKKLFNKLPKNIRNIKNIQIFKKELKRFLLLNSFYTMGEFMDHVRSN